MDKKPHLIVIHSFKGKPNLELVESPYAKDDQVYIVPKGEVYTISKTDEQKEDYIQRLEKEVKELRSKLYQIDCILNPDDEPA